MLEPLVPKSSALFPQPISLLSLGLKLVLAMFVASWHLLVASCWLAEVLKLFATLVLLVEVVALVDHKSDLVAPI